MAFPLTVTATALETRRDVRVRYTDGTGTYGDHDDLVFAVN